MSNTTQLNNPNLKCLHSDYLYHLNINVASTENTKEIQEKFGDVKVICMGGTDRRMQELAKYLRSLLGFEDEGAPIDFSAAGNRYALYKVGPVLCVSHGVGSASCSVVLHEVLKLLMYAKCKDPIILRLGTCGGLGVKPGTVIVTKDAFNGYLRNEHEIPILGNRIVRPASFPDQLIKEIITYGTQADDGFETIRANTMSTDCFYEGQGRIDGAVCEYTDGDKMNFLQKCYDKGIRNIEMEATMLASLTLMAGVRAGDVCVTLVDRLKGDQVTITMDQKHEFERRPFLIVGRFIKKLLEKNQI